MTSPSGAGRAAASARSRSPSAKAVATGPPRSSRSRRNGEWVRPRETASARAAVAFTPQCLRFSISFAQQMQLRPLIHVSAVVEKLMLIDEAMTRAMPRRFVRVAKPALHAGLGHALRQAYDLNGCARDISPFEDLLCRLR